MDRLRAVQYFVAAAEAGSLSGAARRFGVSPTAVAKMITALERALGARLFERGALGLALTASGAQYLESCAPALERLELADEMLRASTTSAAGTIVVGVQHVIAREILTPALPRFHARYPGIEIDAREFQRATARETRGVDVFLVLGWPEPGDLVQRRIAAARYRVVASPAYWKAHGMPRHPHELADHACLAIRNVDGTVMDQWTFARGGEEAVVNVRGWLVASNAQRDIVVDLALAGQGVVRILDWTNRHDVASGALVEALADWESPEAPPVNLLYRPSVRRIPRVRAFLQFVVDVFRDLEAARGLPVAASARPPWLDRPYARASASARAPR